MFSILVKWVIGSVSICGVLSLTAIADTGEHAKSTQHAAMHTGLHTSEQRIAPADKANLSIIVHEHSGDYVELDQDSWHWISISKTQNDLN